MTFSSICLTLGFLLVLAALFIETYACIKGPDAPDRIWALDTLSVSALGLVGLFAFKNGQYVYVDVAIALALVSFLGTVIFARFIKWMAEQREASND